MSEPQIWVCTCGCETFFLRADYTIECAHCGKISDGGVWCDKLPDEVKAEPWPRQIVVRLDTSQANLKHIMSKARVEDTACLLVVQRNGLVHSWRHIETDEQRDWLLRRLDEAKGSL